MEFNPLWMFLPVIILLMLGYPIGYVLGGVGIITGLIFWGPEVFQILAHRFFMLQWNFILIAVPLFVLMGCVLERSGVAEKLYGAFHIWMGSLRGGLALATVFVCTIMAAATGIVAASVTMMGLLALPQMLKRGYNTELAAGTVMAAGTLGQLIPPSVMLVIYGAWAQLPVGRLFMAAIFPGLVLSGLYIGYILIRTGLRPELGPPLPEEERGVPLRQKLLLLLTSIVPPIFLILAVLGTIFFGVATPTEAASMGVVGSLIIAAMNRRLTFSVLKEAAYRTAKILGMFGVVSGGSYSFIGIFMGLGGGPVVEDILLGLELGPWGTLAVMMLILLILGMFIDWIAIVMLIVPLFSPLLAPLGFDPLWFGILVAVNLQASFLSPPFGFALFLIRGLGIPGVTMADLMRSVIPFVLLIMIGVALVAVFPQLALWLPSVMMR